MKDDILHSLKEKGNGFSIPQGYFDRIEDEVSTKLVLDNFPDKTALSIPENYFNGIEDKVFYKLQQEKGVPKGYFDTIEDRVFEKLKEESKPKVISLSTRIRRFALPLAAAASLALIFVLNYNSSGDGNLSIVEADIDALIEDDLLILNTYEIAEVYEDTDIEDFTVTEDIELTDYLNGIDVESIMLEN